MVIGEYSVLLVMITAVWNLITFVLYGTDKRKARKGKWRTSELALIACAFMMGGVGAFLGMRIIRHKTRHTKFKALKPLAILVNVGAVALGLYLADVVQT